MEKNMDLQKIKFLKNVKDFETVTEGYGGAEKFLFTKNGKRYFIKVGEFQTFENLEQILSDADIPHPKIVEIGKFDETNTYIIEEAIDGMPLKYLLDDLDVKFVYEYGFRLGEKIINLIKNEYVLDDIVNRAKDFIKECKEENKQRIVIQQNINENHGIIIGMQSEEIDFEYLYLSEIQMAINRLEKFDLEPIIKKRSIGILHNLRKAIKKKSNADFLVCKNTFNKYIVGNGAELIIDVLKEFYYISLCLDLENKMGDKDEK